MVIELTCRSCRHWRKQPLSLENAQSEITGECREQPHAVVAPQQLPNGTIIPALQVMYIRVPENFPACGRHEINSHTQPANRTVADGNLILAR